MAKLKKNTNLMFIHTLVISFTNAISIVNGNNKANLRHSEESHASVVEKEMYFVPLGTVP